MSVSGSGQPRQRGRLAQHYDVIVVGGGPAGLAAALAARRTGAARVLIVDREAEPGGILPQCIHAGFGLHHFRAELTGPEYAQRFLDQVREAGVEILCDAFVLDIDAGRRVRLTSPARGAQELQAGAVVLAMGARERTRGAVGIPGSRPAGVFTAGLAQRLVNMLGVLPGRRAVILGSGDIGLIMARRLTLEGVEVAAVLEIMPHPSGLSRNVVQCLHDFRIPLHLSHTVTAIHGDGRVERVTAAPVDAAHRPLSDQGWDIPCDTLLLAVGLIPENELSRRLGLEMDPATGGPVVDSAMQTSMDGVFACGNVVHIHDVVDFVTEEALLAGEWAGRYAQGCRRPPDTIRLAAGANVACCVPHSLAGDRLHTLYLRARRPLAHCRVRLGHAWGKRLRYAFPAEMITLSVAPGVLQGCRGRTLRVDLVPR